jgi:hypothetical protein
VRERKWRQRGGERRREGRERGGETGRDGDREGGGKREEETERIYDIWMAGSQSEEEKCAMRILICINKTISCWYVFFEGKYSNFTALKTQVFEEKLF